MMFLYLTQPAEMHAMPDVKNTQGLYYRHTLPVRIMHWINAIAFFLLLMSGLQIFNAHPALHWGRSSYDGRPPLLQMYARQAGQRNMSGITQVAGHDFVTTGVLGASRDADGTLVERGFPAWATLPGPQWLAMGRRWHLFFAWVLVLNGLAYLAYAVFSRHLARDLAPDARDWRSIGTSIRDHLLLRHPQGEAAKRYNVLQKLAYLAVIFVLLPLMIVTGWSMSPRLDAVLPGWVDVLGGRQSGRTIHFVVAWLLFGFVLVHVFEVIVSGFWNHLRSMITGRFSIRAAREGDDAGY
ncbi:MAG TPA: cytochrome b/b6 domain-containing protein [Noviherbaspirillum sp.]|nr:cytochrome b/b6 domain-containing protein [Noviherbaspirillum sp.]